MHKTQFKNWYLCFYDKVAKMYLYVCIFCEHPVNTVCVFFMLLKTMLKAVVANPWAAPEFQTNSVPPKKGFY